MPNTRLQSLAVFLIGSCLLFTATLHAKEFRVLNRAAPIATEPESQTGRYMFSVSLHTADEIDGFLKRAEMLAKTTRKTEDSTGIALVLHGPEIEIFSRANYNKYKQVVDKAARLDGDNVVEIKICQTQMNIMGIKQEDLPGFIEIVPYGPDEQDRLRKKGYVDL